MKQEFETRPAFELKLEYSFPVNGCRAQLIIHSTFGPRDRKWGYRLRNEIYAAVPTHIGERVEVSGDLGDGLSC